MNTLRRRIDSALNQLAYGLLLWRQTRNQVFQDDAREILETYIDDQ